MLARGILSLLALLLTACQGDIAVSPPEQQRTLVYQPQALGAFARMNQINADQHIVSGIYKVEQNSWRWTAGQAVLRFYLKDTVDLKYSMKFGAPREVLEYSRPLDLRIMLNGKPWEELRYDKEGVYEFEKAVPAGFLRPQAENLVRLEIGKPRPPVADSPELGFILVHAGFQPVAEDP
jgi:hypothetical protein